MTFDSLDFQSSVFSLDFVRMARARKLSRRRRALGHGAAMHRHASPWITMHSVGAFVRIVRSVMRGLDRRRGGAPDSPRGPLWRGGRVHGSQYEPEICGGQDKGWRPRRAHAAPRGGGAGCTAAAQQLCTAMQRHVQLCISVGGIVRFVRIVRFVMPGLARRRGGAPEARMHGSHSEPN